MAEVVRRGDTRNVQPAPTAAALAPPMIAAFMKFRRDGGLRGASADGDVASAGAAVSATGGFTSSAVDLAFSPSDPDSSDMDWFRTKRVSDVTLSLWDYIGDEVTFGKQPGSLQEQPARHRPKSREGGRVPRPGRDEGTVPPLRAIEEGSHLLA